MQSFSTFGYRAPRWEVTEKKLKLSNECHLGGKTSSPPTPSPTPQARQVHKLTPTVSSDYFPPHHVSPRHKHCVWNVCEWVCVSDTHDLCCPVLCDKWQTVDGDWLNCGIFFPNDDFFVLFWEFLCIILELK